MAEFCLQCNIEIFGVPHSDFSHFGEAGVLDEKSTENGEGMLVLCEGCGPCVVNHKGECMGNCDGFCRNDDGSLPKEVIAAIAAYELRGKRGIFGWLIRKKDWFFGNRWEPGYIHYIRWKYRDWRYNKNGRNTLDFHDNNGN